MKKTTTPLQTPSPHTAQSHMSTEVGTETNTLAEFFSATLTMSWQLAIVVLIPVLGGFELDKKLHTKPFLTIIGFVLAIAGVAFVVWRQFQLVRQLSTTRTVKEPRS
jgi:F0F1-type ATP synthase assembly protein I